MAAFYNYSAGADLCASREQSQACLSYAETKQSVRSNRVAASLGGGGLKATGSNPGMQERANGLFWESHDRVNGRTLQETGQALPAWEYCKPIDGIPGRMNASVEFYLNDLYYNLKMLAEEQHQEKDVYFYHSDHLGSASWITDGSGIPVQHLQYLPFGEPFVDQHPAGYQERFQFTGERRLKLTGESNRLDVNADFMTTGTLLNTPTLYPSAYLVLTSKGYTNVTEVESRASSLALPRCSNVTERKHYYAGADRVAASLGGGGLKAVSSNPEMQERANGLFWESHDRVNGRTLQETGQALPAWEYCKPIDGIPGRMKASVEFYLNDLYYNLKMLAEEQHQEKDVYFYHSDHLGSASWITDADGKPIQHLQYLPFGEPFVNQHLTDYQERFRFTGKERDEETGYGYFGARYMDHELTAMWLSVDPMADKYPSISPYAYCAWNPIKLIDPDGREIGDFYSKDGTYLNTDGKKDGKVYIVKDEAWGTEIMDDRRKHKKNATLNLDKVESFKDENGNDLFLTEDIIKKVSSAENLSSDGNEHGFFYRKNIETPERELKSFPDHLTFNKYSDLVLSIHTHPQGSAAIMSGQDHADMDQIPINIVIGNNQVESGNVKTSGFSTYRVANFYRNGDAAFSMNMTSIKKMVKRINNKNK